MVDIKFGYFFFRPSTQPARSCVQLNARETSLVVNEKFGKLFWPIHSGSESRSEIEFQRGLGVVQHPYLTPSATLAFPMSVRMTATS